MKLEIEINYQEKCFLLKDYFKKVIAKTIKLGNFKFSGKINLSLAIVSEKEIKRINRIYRKKDKITDILSFSDYSKKSAKGGSAFGGKKEDVFCELIICLPYIKKSAKKDKVTLKKEMAYVISHGVLHCIGFIHSKKMYEIQDKVCQKF